MNKNDGFKAKNQRKTKEGVIVDNREKQRKQGTTGLQQQRTTTTGLLNYLNSLAILTAHREYEPHVDEVLAEFIGLNELRQRIFGP